MDQVNATPTSKAVGQHLLVDMYGISASRLCDGPGLVQLLLDALSSCGFNIVHHCSHEFPGDFSGATAVVLLAESHATFHSYPEHQYLAVDIFSCGKADPRHVVDRLVDALQPERIVVSENERGERR
jgi:S-adenosylmethionine decarboxylase